MTKVGLGLLAGATLLPGLVRTVADRKRSDLQGKTARLNESLAPPTGCVTLEEARRIIDAAHNKAVDIGVPQNIAVVDSGGKLVAFERMDGAWLGSIEIAIDKAYTSRAFDITTKALGEMTQPGEPLFGIHTQPHVVIFAGGIPLRRKGEVVGAVGVSGGTVDQDQEVAEAGIDVFV